jgi:hypothetical protein
MSYSDKVTIWKDSVLVCRVVGENMAGRCMLHV